MSDIALEWNADLGAADFAIVANDLARDDGLETAVMLSLFTDRRAEGDVLPAGETDRRGWWGDAHPVVSGDQVGSRLWLLSREKGRPTIQARAEEYAREALAWLIEDQISDRVDVESEIVKNGVLALSISIHRPGADVAQYRYQYTWVAQQARRA